MVMKRVSSVFHRKMYEKVKCAAERRVGMEIVVCFQISSDYDEVLDDEWKDGAAIDFTYTKKMYGCFDEGALETALCLKDAYKERGVPVTLRAVTSGLRTPALMTALYGAGFDEVLYVDAGRELTSMEKEIVPLSSIVNKKANAIFGADIILTGRMSGGLDDRMTAQAIAEWQGSPWLMDGVELRPGEKEREVFVLCEQDDAYILRKQQTPFVCSMGNAVHGVLRMFSLKARMEARKKKIMEVTLTENHFSFPEFSMKRKERKGHCQWISGSTEEMAAALTERIREVK